MTKLLLAIAAITILAACGSTQHTRSGAASGSSAAGADSQPAIPTAGARDVAGSTGADGPITADPCSLLTGGEVAAALGGVAESKAGSGLSGGPSCTWTFHQPSTGFATLYLELLTAELCKTERSFQGSAALVNAPGNTLYTDIGLGGLFNGSAIDVVTAQSCFHIDGPTDPATIVAVARTVAGKLS